MTALSDPYRELLLAIEPHAGQVMEPEKKKKRKKHKKFDLDACLDFVAKSELQLAKWRYQYPLGEFVTNFCVPLDVCPPINVYLNMFYLARTGKKDKARKIMSEQIGREPEPLTGKPVILAVRFSCKKSDHETSWHKIIIDRLLSRKTELNYIKDDSTESIDLHSTWLKAPLGKGFGYVEIWSGVQGQ